MKPSERIELLMNQAKMFDDIAPTWHEWIEAILQYLDEQAQKGA